ncbi:hypothetical protein [Paeniglutamicibacter psychrophenolicus]|uniref:hypothetical protein n=1 Tax=Paeniglutamicibacter psychrophenolicus TaxID=257454 RepID=UPI00277EF95A|nr:hypothetical protein [Paeniglutamicibacter psychrophenolicus]MDQ0093123.1 hypothetical protein [Paeniglutamicibacter psychrophenolicus]
MQLFIPAQGPPPELSHWAAAIGGFAPVATFLVVGVAFLAYRQKTKADKRAEWWKRAQWTIDNSLSEDAQKQDVGLTVLQTLGKSGLATKEDSALFEEVSSAVYGEYLDEELDAALAEEAPAGDNDETNGEGGTDANDHDG